MNQNNDPKQTGAVPVESSAGLAALEQGIAEAEKEFTRAQLKESYWNCIVREQRQKVRDLKRKYKAARKN